MLTLTRTEGQSVRIGPDVVVTVTRVGGGRVRLGITAPPGTHVLREELIGTPPRILTACKRCRGRGWVPYRPHDGPPRGTIPCPACRPVPEGVPGG